MPSIPNGNVYYSRSPVNGQYSAGTTAYFTCNNLYERSGPSQATCLLSGSWSQQPATCNEGDDFKSQQQSHITASIMLENLISQPQSC